MAESLPAFRYHPDPVASGVVEASDSECRCCRRVRGYIYTGPVYSPHESDGGLDLCPWCIADGSAAATLDASFADGYPLSRAGVSKDVIEEVTLRTPGFESWQQETWLSHCGDACEFRGDATTEDVTEASNATKQHWMLENDLGEPEWAEITDGYSPGGDPAIYKFVCKHCRLVLFGWDCS
jgi:hypothetical protein